MRSQRGGVILFNKYFAKSSFLLVFLAYCVNTVMAESTYGNNLAGTGSVIASARVNMSVTVSKLILLKVGTAGSTVNTLSWNVVQSIPAAAVTPVTTADNVGVIWDGNAPTNPVITHPAALAVSAWTNAATTSTVNCAMGAWLGPAGGPANVNFAVTSAGTLTHPGANLNVCAATTFPKNTVATGTWAYTLAGTPSNWPAGIYTNTITYTAAGI